MEQKGTFTEKCRVWFKGFADVSARFLLKIGLTADAVTLIGCLGHVGAAYLAAIGQFTWAGVLLIVFAIFDFFDGTMARMSNNGAGTRFGSFWDSTTDRIAEFLIFGGIAFFYAKHNDLLSATVAYAAISGSILVSYTRAKGEILGLNMKLGLMSRLERYLVLVPCLFFGFANVAVWIIAIGSWFTVGQRILHVKKNC